ncbi:MULTISPECIES: ArnT family glycosyltransferase [unclassified Pseudomonas]|uniref:ArnT family glycosyltransferase n=1 Tax=unclassified Pseudomonas TaxID=196821 RepID=UPI0025CC0C9F|nr:MULTISPECIES: glycosyltransferase family 39 protein [unclassified Pseudomonas]
MTSQTAKNKNAYTLLVMIALVFFALLLKNNGLFPFVFADEYTYSRYSRLEPLSHSLIPGYLYLGVYSLTNHCATDFLGCARLFNALFFVGAAPFIYWVARRVTSFRTALLITFCAMAAPINIYTAHYMPEAFYFFSFWVFVWALSRARVERWQDWAGTGLVLGCSALVKPHSMLIVPAVLIYIGYLSASARERRLATSLRNIGAFLLAALVAKFALSLMLAGPTGLTFFGPSYNKIASSTTSGWDRVIELATLALQSLNGHILALCLIVGLPLAVALNLGASALGAHQRVDASRRLAILAVLLIANLLPVVALFSASVINSSVFESITRLHMRYYDFMFPLLWIVVASRLGDNHAATAMKWRAVLGTLIVVPTLYALYTHMVPYQPSIIDSPELRGLTVNTPTFYLIGAAALIALGSWVYSARLGAALFVYCAMPLGVLLPNVWVTLEQRAHLVPDVYDRAGQFARAYLTPEQRGQVVVIGTDMGGMLKASFYMDNPDITHAQVTEDNHYDFKGLPLNKTWVLSIGPYVPYANGRLQVIMPGFALTHVENGPDLDLRQPLPAASVSRSEGISAPESGGVWSVGPQVRLDFTKPLPDRFRLHLRALAFGPNVGQRFSVHAGSAVQVLTPTDQMQDYVFDIDNHLRASSIRIDVPQPTSPAQLGLSADGRLLGIALQRLSIEPLEQ